MLREDFRSGSDADLLVSFEEGIRHSLFDLMTVQDELQAILDRGVSGKSVREKGTGPL